MTISGIYLQETREAVRQHIDATRNRSLALVAAFTGLLMVAGFGLNVVLGG